MLCDFLYPMKIELACKVVTKSNANSREHYRVKAKRIAAERAKVGEALEAVLRWEQPSFVSADSKMNGFGRQSFKLHTPVIIKMIRVAPSKGLDDDNLYSALKGVRDSIAEVLGFKDDSTQMLKFEVGQKTCKKREGYMVEVTIQPYRTLRVAGNGDVVSLLASKLTSTQVKDLGVPRLVGGRIRLDCQNTIVDVLIQA